MQTVEIRSSVVTSQYVRLTVIGEFSGAVGQVVAILGEPDRLSVQSNVLYPNGTSVVQLSADRPRSPKWYNGKFLTVSFTEQNPNPTTPAPKPYSGKAKKLAKMNNLNSISSQYVDVKYALITAVIIFAFYWYYNLRK